MVISILVSFVVSTVVPISGDIDRTDQRAQTADGLLRRTSPGTLQKIYIVDCGVTSTADTSGRVVAGFTAPGLSSTTPPHGTLMASIAAGQARGLAPQASIIDVKVCDGANVDIDKFKLGLDYLINQVPGVVNISLEWRLSVGNPNVGTIQNKIAALKSLGFIVVVAAGNGVSGTGVLINDGTFVTVPASASDAVTVASVQYGAVDQRWASSNFGPEVDFFAAATLQAIEPGGTTLTDTGTSGSTALASGAIAAAASFGATSSGASLDNFVRAGAIWSTISNGNSPNAAKLFSDLGTVSQSAFPLPSFGNALFCGFGISGITKTVSIAAGPSGERYSAIDIRCPTTPTPVLFVIKKVDSAGVSLFETAFWDPNSSNSAVGEEIRSLVLSPDGTRIAFAATSRETARFSLTNSVGTTGGLDAYLVQMNASTGAILTATRLATTANDAARAVVYSGAAVHLAAVIEGSLGLPLQGTSDLAVATVNYSSSALAATSFPRPGDVRINAGTLFEGQPVFVGAANSDPSGTLFADFQATGFQVINGTFLGTIYWLPQPGGDSEARSVSAPTLPSQSNNLFIASTRRVWPQPISWHFIRLDRASGGSSQWNTVWTAASQYLPALVTTPEADIYVRTGTSLLKASRDSVNFNESQPVAASEIVLSGSNLISISSSSLPVRLGR